MSEKPGSNRRPSPYLDSYLTIGKEKLYQLSYFRKKDREYCWVCFYCATITLIQHNQLEPNPGFEPGLVV